MHRRVGTTAVVAALLATAIPASFARTGGDLNGPSDQPAARSLTPRGGAGAGRQLLIYGPSLAVSKRVNERRVARRLGFDVTVATAAEWTAMTQGEFEAFDALVFGDPSCKSGPARLEAAVGNQDTWSPAVDGDVVLSGFDPVFHAAHGIAPGPERLIANALRFAGTGPGTGLSVSLSCYYFEEPAGTPVALLDGIGSFTVTGQGRRPMPGCPDRIEIVEPGSPVVDRLNDRRLSKWECSAHQAFDDYPAAFVPVAIEAKKSDLPVLLTNEA